MISLIGNRPGIAPATTQEISAGENVTPNNDPTRPPLNPFSNPPANPFANPFANPPPTPFLELFPHGLENSFSNPFGIPFRNPSMNSSKSPSTPYENAKSFFAKQENETEQNYATHMATSLSGNQNAADTIWSLLQSGIESDIKNVILALNAMDPKEVVPILFSLVSQVSIRIPIMKIFCRKFESVCISGNLMRLLSKSIKLPHLIYNKDTLNVLCSSEINPENTMRFLEASDFTHFAMVKLLRGINSEYENIANLEHEISQYRAEKYEISIEDYNKFKTENSELSENLCNCNESNFKSAIKTLSSMESETVARIIVDFDMSVDAMINILSDDGVSREMVAEILLVIMNESSMGIPEMSKIITSEKMPIGKAIGILEKLKPEDRQMIIRNPKMPLGKLVKILALSNESAGMKPERAKEYLDYFAGNNPFRNRGTILADNHMNDKRAAEILLTYNNNTVVEVLTGRDMPPEKAQAIKNRIEETDKKRMEDIEKAINAKHSFGANSNIKPSSFGTSPNTNLSTNSNVDALSTEFIQSETDEISSSNVDALSTEFIQSETDEISSSNVDALSTEFIQSETDKIDSSVSQSSFKWLNVITAGMIILVAAVSLSLIIMYFVVGLAFPILILACVMCALDAIAASALAYKKFHSPSAGTKYDAI